MAAAEARWQRDALAALVAAEAELNERAEMFAAEPLDSGGVRASWITPEDEERMCGAIESIVLELSGFVRPPNVSGGLGGAAAAAVVAA